MRPKQRVRAVLDRQPVDHCPADIWYTEEVLESLRGHTGLQDELEIYRALGIDKIRWFGAKYAGPLRLVGTESERATHWGCRTKRVQAGKARYWEYADKPLQAYPSVASLDDYPWWPDPERFDYDAMVREVERSGDEFASNGPWISFFEIYCALRGLEQALMDVMMDPPYVHAVLDRIEAIQTELLHQFLPRVRDTLDLVFISDDMGNQNGMMLSMPTWREFFRERMHRWCRLIHDYGLRVMFHSDGGIEPLIPELIEAGVDVLNPIQHRCAGMELAALKQKYGDHLIFHGGVDNQHVLPFGTREDVRRETLRCIETLGAGGGYICCSCHNIQAGTPVENIIEMVSTARETVFA